MITPNGIRRDRNQSAAKSDIMRSAASREASTAAGAK